MKILILNYCNPPLTSVQQCAMQRRLRLLVSEAGVTRFLCYCLFAANFDFELLQPPLNQCTAVCNATEAEAAGFGGWCDTVPLLLPAKHKRSFESIL